MILHAQNAQSIEFKINADVRMDFMSKINNATVN